MDIKQAILTRRAAIRYHRDQKGDDRCWVDDYFVWRAGDETVPDIKALPAFEQFMGKCRLFHTFCNAIQADPMLPGAITDKALWDRDLDNMDDVQLAQELSRLTAAIHQHHDMKDRPLTADDDRALYAVLPEKLPADFRLPPEKEFIGEARKPHAGCPSFWRSHAACVANCDLHRWGPCG